MVCICTDVSPRSSGQDGETFTSNQNPNLSMHPNHILRPSLNRNLKLETLKLNFIRLARYEPLLYWLSAVAVTYPFVEAGVQVRLLPSPLPLFASPFTVSLLPPFPRCPPFSLAASDSSPLSNVFSALSLRLHRSPYPPPFEEHALESRKVTFPMTLSPAPPTLLLSRSMHWKAE
eukprot:3953474-Pleurochrysis_carterae.AAC.2